MAAVGPRFVTLIVGASALLALGARPVPTAALPDVLPNENRIAAGRLVNGVQRIELEVQEASWHLEGKGASGLAVYTFAEKGKAPQVPGPLVRIQAGTELNIRIHNGLAKEVCIRGLQDHSAAALDSVTLAPNETREVRFRVDVPGTYMYWGRTEPLPANLGTGTGHDSQLVGAFVVDPAGAKPMKNERVMLISFFYDTVAALGQKSDNAFELMTKFNVRRDQWITWAVNGLMWPHTERMSYTVGDTVRWRVINGGRSTHPMHLHGFYYDILSRGDALRDTVYGVNDRRKAVTEPMATRTSMMMQWVPTRPGNWLFHCHLIDHIDGTLRFFTKPDEHGSHAEQEMAGLVMGIQVRPASNVAQAAEPMARRKLRLFVNERANVYRSRPGYSYVLQDGATEPARDSLLLPSSTLVLHRNEPTEITVINHSHAMASIHWHGIELESFYDGVSGWSGWGSRTAPVIVPGDSFVVRMTPDRAGTFIYHTHSDETEQLASGLYGALFVVDDKVPMDTTQRVFLLGSGGPQSDAPDFVNGSATPPSVDIRAGTPHRFRLINISTTDAKIIRLMGDSAVQWRSVAKDGAELPARQATVRPATVTMLPGETYDFEVRRPKPESMRLEILNGSFPARPSMKIPVNVH